MVKRTLNMGDTEPEQRNYKLVPEGKQFLQVVDVIENIDPSPDILHVKCEMVDGTGGSLLNRLSLDEGWKGFFATRLFLKAIGEPHKGEGVEIDTDNWIGRRFWCEVVHNGDYANIKEYYFDEAVEQPVTKPVEKISPEDVAWDD